MEKKSSKMNIDEFLDDMRKENYFVPSWDHEGISQDAINKLATRIFGIPWALISLRTTVSEFCEVPWPFAQEPKPEFWLTVHEAYSRIEAEYGVKVSVETHPCIVDVLREILGLASGQTKRG